MLIDDLRADIADVRRTAMALGIEEEVMNHDQQIQQGPGGPHDPYAGEPPDDGGYSEWLDWGMQAADWPESIEADLRDMVEQAR